MSENRNKSIIEGPTEDEMEAQRKIAAQAHFDMLRAAEERYWREINHPFGMINRWF